MLPKLHIEPEAVEAALEALGLERQVLFEAVLAGLLARDACTANDPPFLPGIYQWGRTVRVLREVLAPLGWSRSDEGNFCTVVEPEGRFAIAVASGCEQTGVAGREMPTTKCRKGPNTAGAVYANEQLYLFGELAPVVTRAPIEPPGSCSSITTPRKFALNCRCPIRSATTDISTVGPNGSLSARSR